jgi:hypothetical protein
MNPVVLLNELRAAGIWVEPTLAGNLRLTPKNRLTPELIEQVRAAKPELLALLAPEFADDSEASATPIDPVAKALTLIARLRAYVLPDGRIPAARIIAERLVPLSGVTKLDPSQALAALQAAEAELMTLGGTYDRELADAIALITNAFPGSRLIGVRTLQ